MFQYLLRENGKGDLTKKFVILLGCENIVQFIKALRIRWLGHIERLSEERMPKMTLYAKIDSGRKRGRSRKRWIDDLDSDPRNL